MDLGAKLTLDPSADQQNFIDDPALLSMSAAEALIIAADFEKLRVTPISYPKIFFLSFTAFSALFIFYCSVLGFTRLAKRPKGFIMNISEILVSETQVGPKKSHRNLDEIF